MVRTLNFDEFWVMANSVNESCNSVIYHPCCDVWTTRSSKSKRASHSKNLPWRKLISSLSKSVEEKKEALLAKITDEGWRLPVVLNEACQAHHNQTGRSQAAFRPHQPNLSLYNLQFSNPPPAFVQPSPECPSLQPQCMIPLI